MSRSVVITGIGAVTPLGSSPGEIITAIEAGMSACRIPTSFDASPFDCPLAAEIEGFDAGDYFPGNKTLRMMNRDGHLAVVAASRALADASLTVGLDYPGEDIGLFGSTGMAGMNIDQISQLVKKSADADGKLDMERFGREALRRVRPVLSFKILANMPICFVSIFEGIRGPGAIYTPWEGQGARAIEAGILAVRSGRVSAVVVGGCDAKAHMLGFISLQQQGIFQSWRETAMGTIPGEGGAFLVLEEEGSARARGANIYARIAGWSLRTRRGMDSHDDLSAVLSSLNCPVPGAVIAGADDSAGACEAEMKAIAKLAGTQIRVIKPKRQMGNLFAAAAAAQVCIAAEICRSQGSGAVWANCFGCGCEIGSFALEVA